MIKKNRLNLSFKIFILIFLLVFPFSYSNYSDNIKPEKITSDLAFYEINTCSISLFEFIVENPNVIYQDHYKVKFNDYSSFHCFGTITGVDQINHVFYISIGTNSIVNLFLQTFIWLTLISFLPRKKYFKISSSDFLASILTSLVFCYGIYSESRYYQTKLFEIDLTIFSSYIKIFLFFLFISIFTYALFESRSESIINYLPYTFLLMGLYSGFNLYIHFLFFAMLGIRKILQNQVRFKFYFISLILIWSYLASNTNFYLLPDKIRGLSNTSFNPNSIIYWSLLTIFIITGIYKFLENNRNKINLELLATSFLNTSVLLIIFGILSAANPVLNFLSYYFFGLTKFGTDNQNLFGVNTWNERIAWRGVFPSAETVGEFYAITILFSVIIFLNLKSSNYKTLLLLFFPLLGLLASNNRAAFILLITFVFLKIVKKYNLNNISKGVLISFLILLLFYFIGFANIQYSFEFSASNYINLANDYSLDKKSSALTFFNNIEKGSFINIFFLIIGQLAFLINRSELWGIYISRYNPNYFNLFFGTGPFSLAKHYGDVKISSKKISTDTDMGFLLTHSSFLLILTFFGVIGLIFYLNFLIKRLKYLIKHNYDFFLMSLFLTINLIKSDSILYFPFIIIYLVFINYDYISKSSQLSE